MYAIIDLESTGGKYNEEGITEVAIYKFDGQEIIDQFSCLVNPERKIQPFVQKLTGINNAMLRHAPTFSKVAKRIIEITEGCIVVAHNAKFDYRLLRTEFSRIGYDYQRQTICTVELSRKLIPGLPSYSLGKLVKNLGIPLTDRHRAIGDAKATVKLFRLLLTKDSDKTIVQASIKRQHKKRATNTLIRLVEQLPAKTGVYYMHDAAGNVIYIGKSKNIQQQVNQHFTKNNHWSKQLRQNVSSVSYDLTGNSLFAELKQRVEIQKVSPKYNRPIPPVHYNYALYLSTDKQGYFNLKLQKINPKKSFITAFKTRKQGKQVLEKMIEDYALCLKLVGMHRTTGGCFDYSLKKCYGACIGEESADSYNSRVKQLISAYSFEDRTLLVVGPGREPAEKSVLLIEKGALKGMGYYDLNYQLHSPEIIRNLITPMPDDFELKQLILSNLRAPNPFKIVKL